MQEAEIKWQEGQPLVALWMAGSAVSLLSSLFWLPLGFIGGILGIAGASMMLCRCHHCFNLALAVKVRPHNDALAICECRACQRWYMFFLAQHLMGTWCCCRPLRCWPASV